MFRSFMPAMFRELILDLKFGLGYVINGLMVFLIFFSCETKSLKNENLLFKEDSYIPKVKKVIPLESYENLISPRNFFYDVSYIGLETPDTIQLTVIQKVKQFSGKILIHDNRKHLVLAFDLSGNFIEQVGKKGEGPGEYIEISDFDIDYVNKRICLYSRYDRAILWYDENLDFIKEVTIDEWGSQISILESGNVAIYSLMENANGGYNIKVYNYDGFFVSEFMPFPKVEGGFVPTDFSGFLNNNYFTYPYSSIIYSFDDVKNLEEPIFEFDFPERSNEKDRFNHRKFLEKDWENQIFGKFEFGEKNDEGFFCYTIKSGLGFNFVMGIFLSCGEVFGHYQLKHGVPNKDDIYIKLFFNGAYGLPTYDKFSNFFYVGRNLESTAYFYDDIKSNLGNIKNYDVDLYNTLVELGDIEKPFLMKFRLKKNYYE